MLVFWDADTIARRLADVINPALVFVVVAAPLLPLRSHAVAVSPQLRLGPYGRWIAFSAVSIGVAVVLAETGKRVSVWHGHPSFPSGHETFAASAAACLILRDGRMAVVALPLAVAMGIALVRAGFHVPVDVVGGVILGATITFAVSKTIRPRV